MKLILKNLVALAQIWLLLVIIASTNDVQAKSYKVTRVFIEAHIQQNGTILYKELRTYSFDGSYSKANYELSRRGFDSIRNVTISEDGVPFILSESDYAGTYSIREKRNSIDISWNYEAEDETKTFEISFLIEGGIVVGPYDSEFFWTYLSDRWETGTEELQVRLYFPESVDQQRVFTWVRGSDNKVILDKLENGFQLNSVERFTKSNEVAVRLIFPTSLINAPITHADFSLESVLEAEEKRHQEAIAAQQRYEILLPYGRTAGIIICLFSVFVWVINFRKYGVKHRTGQRPPDVLFSAPIALNPAIASWLMFHRNVVANALAATIFDLARRGYYVMEEHQIETKFLKKEKTVVHLKKTEDAPSREGLLEYEIMLMDYLDEKLSIDPRIDKIFRSHDTKLAKWYSKWSKSLKEYGKSMNLIDLESKKQMKKLLLIQGFLMIISGVLAILVTTPELIVALCVSFSMFIASFALIRYTPEGQLLYDGFKAYFNGLKLAAKRASDGFPSYKKENLDLHMIYAIAFGITGKKLESMLNSMNFHHEDVSWMYFTANSNVNMTSMIQSISSVTNSVVTTTTSFSGAGASAGAAGGGAGGGAS